MCNFKSICVYIWIVNAAVSLQRFISHLPFMLPNSILQNILSFRFFICLILLIFLAGPFALFFCCVS